MKVILKLTLILLFCLPLTSFAEIPEQLLGDFKPVDGRIIMPIGDEYLIDLDASSNISEGDILTLIMSGEKVINPATEKIIKTVERPKGYLQVTKVKSGYSYAKLLTAGLSPQKGDKIRRYDQVPTLFEAFQPAEKLKKELEAKLPNLDWLKSPDDTDAILIFSLDKETLRVVDATGKELKTYRYTDGKISGTPAGIYQTDSFQLNGAPKTNQTLLNQAINRVAKTIGIGGRDKRLENPGITRQQQLDKGIWVGPRLDGNPTGITVGDFDGDGSLEVAVALEDSLKILRMQEKKLRQVAVLNFSPGVHLLSLDSIDIDKNGTPELYLSANVGTALSSQVVEYKAGSYQNTISRIPWLLRVVDLPTEGPVLLAQAIEDREAAALTSPFRVKLASGALKKGENINLPNKASMFSFTPFTASNNSFLFAYISSTDYLHITTPRGADLWESEDNFGGSEVFFSMIEDSDKQMSEPLYIQPRLVTLPSGEILAAKNDGLRVLKRYRKFNKSHIVALKWEGSMLRESWGTREQEGYLVDFTVADADNDGQDEIVMVIKFKQKNLLQKGRSAVVIYELEK